METRNISSWYHVTHYSRSQVQPLLNTWKAYHVGSEVKQFSKVMILSLRPRPMINITEQHIIIGSSCTNSGLKINERLTLIYTNIHIPNFRRCEAVAVEQWLRQVRQHRLCVQWYKLLTTDLHTTHTRNLHPIITHSILNIQTNVPVFIYQAWTVYIKFLQL